MEAMSIPETLLRTEAVRPLKRVEYDRLVAEGYFDDEKVELLSGVVVPMTPLDPVHQECGYVLTRRLEARLQTRARVREATPFAASDVSEPQPDVIVYPNGDYWHEHPARAFLVVEVSRSSLRRDKSVKAAVYGGADVDEYWIVNRRRGRRGLPRSSQRRVAPAHHAPARRHHGDGRVSRREDRGERDPAAGRDEVAPRRQRRISGRVRLSDRRRGPRPTRATRTS